MPPFFAPTFPLPLAVNWKAVLKTACRLGALASAVFAAAGHAALVGAGGYTNGFSTQPTTADWATFSLTGAAGDVISSNQLDAAVQGVDADAISGLAGVDVENPPALNATARWSSTGQYLQTRPTGNKATLLLCRLMNGLGLNVIALNVSCDFTQAAAVGEEVEGHRAYVSLSGAAGSWTPIPAFCSAAPGRLTAILNFDWPPGAGLYLLWADDNGSRSPDTACQIDNFSVIAIPAPQAPAVITDQPESQFVDELQPVTLTVGAQGNPPPAMQWYTNDVPIPHATNRFYGIPSATLDYHGLGFTVTAQNTVSNVVYAATSSVATLTVHADTVRPVLLAAGPSGPEQLVLSFSERLAPGSVTNTANYTLNGPDGSLDILSAALDASQTNIVLTVSPMTLDVDYTLTVDGVHDLAAAANRVLAGTQLSFTLRISPLELHLTRPQPEPLGPSSRRTQLAISEIMFHPANRADGANLEFVELFNSQVFSEDISGYRLSGSISFTFPSNTTMPARSLLVVAASPADLQAAYGLHGVLGPWTDTNGLPNSPGTVRLRNAQDALLLEVNYSGDPPWPLAADGAGHSLVLARPSLGEGDPRAWAASDALGGSPGAFESSVPPPDGLAAVVINEFLANSDAPQRDFIELFNYSTQAVSLAGCFLSDDVATNKFPLLSVVIPAFGFASFDETELGFALTSGGEQILFRAPDGRVLDAVRFRAQARGVSAGRTPDGAPGFRPLANPTPGSNNAGGCPSAVVINEIMYHPLGDGEDEYVELFNRATNSVDLGGWRLDDAVSFTFAPETVLPAGSYLVVAKNAARLMTNYPNLSAANTLGNFNGQLANGGERIALLRAERTLTTNGTQVATNTLYVLENEVTYSDGGRWGQWADGGGSSLELVDPRSNNTLSPNWADSDESGKSEWVTITYTGVLDLGIYPADALQLYLLGAGECLVDDVEVIPQGGANQVSNPGFESGATGWFFQGTHRQSSIQAGGAFSGSRCLHVRASDDGDPGANRIRTPLLSTLASGQTATLRAKVRWLRGHPEILLRLHGGWLEATGDILTMRNLGTPGLPNSAVKANAGPAITEVSHSPVLPAAGQPVSVMARVSDPDGISLLEVRYRLDPGSNLVSVPMHTRGAGWFSASIPAQAGGVLAAFRIVAVDNASPPSGSVFPSDAPARECLVRWGDGLLAGELGTYRFWMTEATKNTWIAREKLSNELLDGTFVYGNFRAIYNAGGKYSGSPFHLTSINSPTGNPCDYRFGFPKDDRLLGGTDARVVMPGSYGDDATQVREQTIYGIARQLDIPFYNRRFVHLFVNGVRRGAVMEDVQQPNDDFIAQWFSGGENGTLHKGNDWIEFTDAAEFASWQRASFQRFTTTGGALKTASYRQMWQLRAADSMNDYTNLFALVETLNLPSPEPYTANTRALVDVEEWMRALVLQRIAGNFDSWGYRYGKNMYVYKPPNARWALIPWDIDFSFNLGSLAYGDGPTTDLFADNGDPVSVKMTSHPPFRRAYWRALQDAVNGPMVAALANARLDEVSAALTNNSVSAIPPTEVKNYISQRRAYILSQLATVAAPFEITPGADFSTNRNLVTLTGRAPVEVKMIRVNGVDYEPAWSSVTNWTMRVALADATNALLLEALDLRGQPLGGLTDTIHITLTTPSESPVGKVVFNEIMSDPPASGASFVELFNASTNTAFDLSGWRINGLGYTFRTDAILGPREFLVLAKDRWTVQGLFGASIPVFDEFPGALQKDGETLTLIQPAAAPGDDRIVDQVRYEAAAPWPAGAAGNGSALQLVDAAQDNSRVCNWTDGVGWRFASYTGVPGGNALYLYLDTGGEVYLDDITLVPGTVPGMGTNYVVNGDFEKALTNGWRLLGSGTNQVTNSVVRGETRHSGTSSLHLVVTGQGGSIARLQQTMSALVRTNVHTLSFWYLPVGGSNNLVMWMGTDFGPRTPLQPGILATPGAMNVGAAAIPPISPVWLNEVQPLNTRTLTNRAGTFGPWVELYNGGTNAVDLGGLYLASSFTDLAQWAFPTGAVLGAGQFKVVFADGRSDLSGLDELHANLVLSPDSGTVALARVRSGQAEVLDYLNYSVSAPDRSFGSLPDGQPFERRDLYATPGATNNGAAPPLVVFINEWMAANNGFIRDPADNDADDWFELFNPGPTAVDLSGCWLTDNLANRYQCQVPNNGHYLIPPGGFMLVWADNETGQNSTNRPDLHVSFKLEKNGEAIGLFATDGTLMDSVTFGPQTNNVSQGRYPDAGGTVHFMATPTPRAPNCLPEPLSPPRLANMTTAAGGEVSFVFTLPSVTTYRVESKNELGSPLWIPLGPDQVGSGMVIITDDIGTNRQRFYRVLLNP